MTILEQFEKLPPFLIYYAAHHERPIRPTNKEMAKFGGLSVRTFIRLAHQTSWRNVTVGMMSKFFVACAVNPLNPEPVYQFYERERSSAEPFKAFDHAQRKLMLRTLDRLAAMAAISKD